MTEIPTIAPLKNVMLFSEMVERTMARPAHLPGMATFHGPSGFGKTFAATYAAHIHRAYYLEVGAFWTVKSFCDALLEETGPLVRGTISEKMKVIIERLHGSRRPLIIDEFDHMVTDKKIDLVREIHDATNIAIILIGEEMLPQKLGRWERVHNRISQWVGAEPATISDAAHLARHYCREIEISEDVIKAIAVASEFRPRRICVNLEQVRQAAIAKGLTAIGMSDLDFKWYTGTAPKGRAFDAALKRGRG